MIGTVKQKLPKNNIDIVREKRYGKKGFNVVVWDYIGGNFHPRAGWIEYGSLEKLYPKSRYNYRYLDKPHGHFGIPYNIKTKKYNYDSWNELSPSHKECRDNLDANGQFQ